MFKNWGIGNQVVSPMDGEENYNIIEANEGKDPVNPHSFNRVFANLLDNDLEVKELISALNKNKNTFDGVIKNIGDNFYLDSDCCQVFDFNGVNYNIFIAPRGFVIDNGKYYYFSDNLRIAERQLSEALKIDDISKDEKLYITKNEHAYEVAIPFTEGLLIKHSDIISYATVDGNNNNIIEYYINYGADLENPVAAGDTPLSLNLTQFDGNQFIYTCYIDKYVLSNGQFIKKNCKYVATDAIDLLNEISGLGNNQTDPAFAAMIGSYFVDGNGDFHPEYFKLRDIFQINVNDNKTYHFGVKNNNLTVSENATDLDLWTYKATLSGSTITIDNTTDLRNWVPFNESLKKKVYLNVEDTTSDTQDLGDNIDPFTDTTLDYSKIENNPAMLIVLKNKQSGAVYESDNAVFAFTGGETISDLDGNTSGATYTNVFMMNKDLYINTGTKESPAYSSVASAIANAKGIETKKTYQQLINDYGVATDDVALGNIKVVYFVEENNTIYGRKIEDKGIGTNPRYNLYWYPVEDPYVQPFTRQGIHTIGDGDFNNGSVAFATFQGWFTGNGNEGNSLYLNSDGSNFYIFDKDGKYTPFYLHSVSSGGTDIWTLTLGVEGETPISTWNTGDIFYVSTLKGGEQYAGTFTVLQAGTQEGNEEIYYSGDLKTFKIKTKLEVLTNKVNVFVNGALKNEALPISTGNITDVQSSGDVISLSTATMSLIEPGRQYYLLDNTRQQTYVIVYSDSEVNVSSFDGSDKTLIAQDDNYTIFERGLYNYYVDNTNNSVVFFEALTPGDVVRVEDRVSVVSNFEATAIGGVFPAEPIFGMEFYLNTTLTESAGNDYNQDGDENDTLSPGWYKYNGSSWVSL